MNLTERRTILVNQINGIKDEQTLEMLEETLAFYNHSNNKDITDGLNELQLQELTRLMEEPAEKDALTEDAFGKLFVRWGTK